MLVNTRLRVIPALPEELVGILLRLNELRSVVKDFIPITLCTTQARVESEKLLWFIQHRDEINAHHVCYATNTVYSQVFRTSVGLYVFDGNHRANAALMTKQRLTAHYIEL